MLKRLLVDDYQSTAHNLSRDWAGNLRLAGVVGLVYFLLAYFVIRGLHAAGLAVFWPSAGFATGVLIVLGPRARLPVYAGVVVAILLVECVVRNDRSLWIALADSQCDAIEPLIAAGLIKRYSDKEFRLDRVRNVLALFIATLAGRTVSSIAAGIASVSLLNPGPPFLSIWWIWFSSGVVGAIAISPFVIGLAAAVREPPPRSELIGGGVALVALAAMTAVIIWLPQQMWATLMPGVLLLPMLLWLAARCQPFFVAVGVPIVALIVAWAAIYGIGHFGDIDLSINGRITQAQAAILFVALIALVLGALFAERRENEARLSRTNIMLEHEREHLSHSNMMLERERDNKLLNVQAALASLGHEIAQPLGAISRNSEAAVLLLEQTPPDYQEVKAALNDIASDVRRTTEVFEAFRVLFGKVGRAQLPIDVNEIVLAVLQSLHEELKSHGVVTRTELTSGMPLANGHSGQLRQVVFNLVNNAIEAMTAMTNRSRVLTVRTEFGSRDAIIVSVQDSGPGIHPERLNGIFGSFLTTKARGTGLGLAICRMIVEQHGGRLSASSDGMSGALFQFVIPIAPKNNHAADAI